MGNSFARGSLSGRLALRNVQRSARDYLVYFLTMMLVTAIMFAFHSLMFSRDIMQLFEGAGILAVMIGLATFFVVLIMAWLINYMVRFILEKRSREFGIYLLIGMKKKEISRLYMRESLLLGVVAFLGGLALGLLLQQILLAALYSMIQMEYQVRLEWSRACLITTAACYGGCYLLALLRCRRRFRKMNIHGLMNSQRQNEEIRESHEEAKRLLLPLSGLFLLVFALVLFFYKSWDSVTIIGFLIGLVLTIYLCYTGVAAWVVCYVRKKGKGIFRGQNLFLMRQFAAKIRTLRFTLGTLTSLFVLALLGCSIAMMFNDYQNQILIQKWPFDVMVFSEDPGDDFQAELEVINRESQIRELHAYPIYQNGTNTVNTWLYTHLRTFGDDYRNEDGSPNPEAMRGEETWAYYHYDTYLAQSDYNRLREMMGLSAVEMGEEEYLLHIKERVWKETGDFTGEIRVEGPEGVLAPGGIYTEPISQDGHNGADYLLIVPDKAARKMTPLYKMLAVNLEEPAPVNLQRELDKLGGEESFGNAGGYPEAVDRQNGGGEPGFGDYQDAGGYAEAEKDPDAGEDMDPMGHRQSEAMACGTDNIVVYVCKNIVRDNVIPEVKFTLSSIIFSFVYIGLVFVCVALTVLSVQQLSDSAKYRFRYQVLHQLGLSRREISAVILKQLAIFSLCPILSAALISGTIAIYVGWKFNFHTGTHTAAAGYFGISFLLFLVVYAVYFIVTYVGFQRNVLFEQHE
ncbi:MAG: ABC transporter permease [Lachnospiraceae bacterium]|nr:ABC transporter permease [Lachnospiraceae bacterium]